MSDRPQRTQWTEKKERKFRSTCGVAHTHKERNRSGCLFVSFHSATHHCKGCTRAITSDRGSPSDTHCAVRMFGRSGDSGTNVNIRIGMFFFFRNAHSVHISLMPSSPFDSLLRSFVYLADPIQGPTPSVDFGCSSPSSTVCHGSTYNMNTVVVVDKPCLHDGSPSHGDITTTDRPS